MGLPFCTGFCAAAVMQPIMRYAGLDWTARLTIEGSLVVLGALGIYMRPPEGANTTKNWDKFVIFGTLISTGVWGMFDGTVINVVNWATSHFGH